MTHVSCKFCTVNGRCVGDDVIDRIWFIAYDFLQLGFNISFLLYLLFTRQSARSHAQLDVLNSITEDYIAGYMQDGRMSVVRRFFCLFVAFDLFFISLLWLICIMASKRNWMAFEWPRNNGSHSTFRWTVIRLSMRFGCKFYTTPFNRHYSTLFSWRLFDFYFWSLFTAYFPSIIGLW